MMRKLLKLVMIGETNGWCKPLETDNEIKSAFDKSHPPAKVVDNVTVLTPDVDRQMGDLRNVFGIILGLNNNGLYRIGTKHGILQNTTHCIIKFVCCRTKFELCIKTKYLFYIIVLYNCCVFSI